jgi:hypothetical protein
MRGLAMGMALGLAALAGPAAAQSRNSFDGTWAFQTEPYGDEQFGVLMSGTAVITLADRDRYDIRLITNELIIQRQTGRSQLITARQTCSGETASGQFNISCRMAEPLEGYEPDNFVLQQGERDQMVGVLSSASSSQVTFTRMR